jgi:hypothetical protein
MNIIIWNDMEVTLYTQHKFHYKMLKHPNSKLVLCAKCCTNSQVWHRIASHCCSEGMQIPISISTVVNICWSLRASYSHRLKAKANVTTLPARLFRCSAETTWINSESNQVYRSLHIFTAFQPGGNSLKHSCSTSNGTSCDDLRSHKARAERKPCSPIWSHRPAGDHDLLRAEHIWTLFTSSLRHFIPQKWMRFSSDRLKLSTYQRRTSHVTLWYLFWSYNCDMMHRTLQARMATTSYQAEHVDHWCLTKPVKIL